MNETTREKPATLEVGMLFETPERTWELTRLGEFYADCREHGNPTKLSQGAISFFLDATKCTFVGWAPGFGPSPAVLGPEPRAGDRWRDARGYSDGGKWNEGKPFTLTGPHGSLAGAWHFGEPGATMYWPGHCFTDGRLAFVDHGEAAPTTRWPQEYSDGRRTLTVLEGPREDGFHRVRYGNGTVQWIRLDRCGYGPRTPSPAPAPEAPTAKTCTCPFTRCTHSEPHRCGMCDAMCPGHAPVQAASPEAPKVKVAPTRREVSSNGREWIKYTPSNPDSFEAFRHRRVDGIEVLVFEGPIETVRRERSYGGMRGPCSAAGCGAMETFAGVGLCEPCITSEQRDKDDCARDRVPSPVVSPGVQARRRFLDGACRPWEMP